MRTPLKLQSGQLRHMGKSPAGIPDRVTDKEKKTGKTGTVTGEGNRV